MEILDSESLFKCYDPLVMIIIETKNLFQPDPYPLRKSSEVSNAEQVV